MKRRGAALIEVILAMAILATVLLPLAVSVASEHVFGKYAQAKMAVNDLAYMKMTQIESKIRSGTTFDENDYYGCEWDPGSEEDMKHNPDKGYVNDPGTFYKEGYPEVRYQFYVTRDGNLYYVHLLVWRRPKTTGGAIIRAYLFEEVMRGA